MAMTTVLRGHFDGRVIVPEVPVDLPRNQRLVIRVEPDEAPANASHGTVEFVAQALAGHQIDDGDAELMRAAIEDACERIDPDPAIDFDAADPRYERRD